VVIYDLVCDADHIFEGWFKNAQDFEEQQSKGWLSCPFCESTSVVKKVAAPKLNRKSNSLPVKSESPTVDGSGKHVVSQQNSESYAKLQAMLGQVHDFVDNNFDDVGNRFASQALDIHHGNREQRNIRGTASAQQLKELADEGVKAIPLPPRPIDKKKLN